MKNKIYKDLILIFIMGALYMVLEGIWNYSDTWGNLYGQICIPYAILWFFLVPLSIYIDDYLRYKLFGEKKPVGILENYKELFTCK
ncbi:MAG: hypothetical protein PHX70_07465 [Clostridium sp.]|nr:hypothetical protein [Clostridium sp.]